MVEMNDVYVHDDPNYFETTLILRIHHLLVYGKKNMSSLLLSKSVALPEFNKIIKMNNRSLWGEFSEDKNEETTEAEIREDKEIYKKKKEDLKILNSK